MNYTNSIVTRSTVAVAIIATLALVPFATFAKSGSSGKISGNTKEVHIADDGTVLVRGATVSSISGGTIVANLNWGSTGMSWTLKSSSSTEFIRSNGGTTTLADLAVGHLISFAGTLDTSSSAFTVNAQVVKDWSLAQAVTLKGEVESANAGASSFVMSGKDGNVTVTTASSTTFSLENGTSVNFGEITVNDEVKVTGMYNASAKTIAATKVVIDNDDNNSDGDDRRWKRLLNFRWNGWLRLQ